MIPVWIPVAAIAAAAGGAAAWYFSRKDRPPVDDSTDVDGDSEAWPPLDGREGRFLWRARSSVQGGYAVDINEKLGFGAWTRIGTGWDADEVVPGVQRWIRDHRS